jgi:4a-hydroxytetrahydrobiopterin dehydratase
VGRRDEASGESGGLELTEKAGRVWCRMSSPLPKTEIENALASLAGWKWENDTLVKTYKFGSFREAISFMVRAAFEAEAMNHHPDWSNVYNRVAVRLTTHDAGDKVTAKDLELAGHIQRVSWVG